MRDSFAANPFCTRFFQPGAIPFFFPPPMTLDKLVERIESCYDPRLAIVGPHGSGKSTLVQHLLDHPQFNKSAQVIGHVRFSAGDTSAERWKLTHRALRKSAAEKPSYLLVDGWEQMDRWLQWWVRWRATRRSARILATSHSLPKHFIKIWGTQVDHPVEQHVLEHILREAASGINRETLVASQAWQNSRKKRGQNLRESLFDMYDWYRDEVDVDTQRG